MRKWVWVFALAAAGCNQTPSTAYQGYVEGDYLLLAAPDAGTLTQLHLQRGQTVAASAPAFHLDPVREEAAMREAAQRLSGAQARADNLLAPRRQRELEALQAQLAQAASARLQAAQDLKRVQELAPIGAVPQAELDTARRLHEQAQAREAELRATLELAQQGIGRDAERAAALADVMAARSVLQQAEWRLAQRTVTVPLAARVQDTFFSAGEFVPAGRAIASLLPDAKVKLRFFVPEPRLGELKLGAVVKASCDGCGAAFEATVSRISTQAEYTPPILYNRDARAKLVFLVEATPRVAADAARLHPGQPIDVYP